MSDAGRTIVIRDCKHYSGSRFTRQTWYAVIRDDSSNEVIADCGHREHRTIQAAVNCGNKLYRKAKR